ncbi:MAG: hypothetical protein IKQ31_00065 [Clostridia bacterium]|nr:hypothetical protein [Clostridia bacterium]
MGYFDYLDDKGKATAGQNKFELHAYDGVVKAGLFTWLVSVLITVVSVILIFTCWPIGKSVYLDLILIFAIIPALIAIFICLHAKKLASNKREVTQLGNCIFIWAVFFALLDAVLIGLNTIFLFS